MSNGTALAAKTSSGLYLRSFVMVSKGEKDIDGKVLSKAEASIKNAMEELELKELTFYYGDSCLGIDNDENLPKDVKKDLYNLVWDLCRDRMWEETERYYESELDITGVVKIKDEGIMFNYTGEPSYLKSFLGKERTY